MADFFMEASMNFKQSDNRFNLIQKRLNRYEHKTIYFNLERMPGIVQSAFIMNSIIPFAKDTDNTIYLNNMDNDPFFSYDTLVKEHIHILDENVGLNPGTVDLIFMNTRAFNPVFFEKFRNMIKVLKESGEIVLIYFKPRKKNLNPPNIKKLFKYLLNQISPEYQEELKSMIPFSDVKEGVLMNDKGSDAFLEEFAQSFEVVKELHSDENVAVFEFKLKKEP